MSGEEVGKSAPGKGNSTSKSPAARKAQSTCNHRQTSDTRMQHVAVEGAGGEGGKATAGCHSHGGLHMVLRAAGSQGRAGSRAVVWPELLSPLQDEGQIGREWLEQGDLEDAVAAAQAGEEAPRVEGAQMGRRHHSLHCPSPGPATRGQPPRLMP